MKKIVLTCLTLGALLGCEHQEPPMEALIPPDPTVAQAPAVIPPYSEIQAQDTMVIQPGSVTNEEIVETNFPEVIEPQTPNGAPLETTKTPLVVPVPQPHYQQNDVNGNNAVNNSDPAVFVSPYAE